MGICISVGSSEIHQTTEYVHEKTVCYEENVVSIGVQRLSSLYSKPGSKGLNQDAAVFYQGFGREDGALCAVFDGHGQNGHIVSRIVRNRLPSLLLSQKIVLTNKKETMDDGSKDVHKWQEACIGAFKVMDKEIKVQENLDSSCSGTTAVVVIRQGEYLVIANLGDSRAVLGTVDENGVTAVQLTTDLKPSVPLEAERIRNCKGRVLALKEEPHIQRVWLPHADLPGLAMSRAFGDFQLKDYGIIAIPDISCHRLTSSDKFLVLATDGVWDVLSNDEVASIIWSSKSEDAAAKAVVDAAKAAWNEKFPSSKVDDCTVVCLFFQNRQDNLPCLSSSSP